MFETIEYNGNTFTVWEELDYFLVVVNDETYILDSMADVREFVQSYINYNDPTSFIY